MNVIELKPRNSNSFCVDNEMKTDQGHDLEAPLLQETKT